MYDLDTWSDVKADYETGNFSYIELSEKYQISDPAIRKRAKEEKWVKGAIKPLIDKERQLTTAQMFAELGLPKELVLQKIKKVLLQTADSTDPKEKNIFDKMLTQYNKMTGQYLERVDLTSGGEKMNNEIKIEVVRGRDETN